MPCQCRVYGCRATSCKINDISLHVFPRSEPQRTIWTEFCGRPRNRDGTKWTAQANDPTRDRICSQHFTEEARLEMHFHRYSHTCNPTLRPPSTYKHNSNYINNAIDGFIIKEESSTSFQEHQAEPTNNNNNNKTPVQFETLKERARAFNPGKRKPPREGFRVRYSGHAIGLHPAMKCVVPECSSISSSRVPAKDSMGNIVRFHAFPKNMQVSARWLSIVKNYALFQETLKGVVNRRLRVCSLHFDDSAYQSPEWRHDRNTRLRWNALPSISVPDPPPSNRLQTHPILKSVTEIQNKGSLFVTNNFNHSDVMLLENSVKSGCIPYDSQDQSTVNSTLSDSSSHLLTSGTSQFELVPPNSSLSPEHRRCQQFALLHNVVISALSIDQSQKQCSRELRQLRKKQERQSEVLKSLLLTLASSVGVNTKLLNSATDGNVDMDQD